MVNNFFAEACNILRGRILVLSFTFSVLILIFFLRFEFHTFERATSVSSLFQKCGNIPANSSFTRLNADRGDPSLFVFFAGGVRTHLVRATHPRGGDTSVTRPGASPEFGTPSPQRAIGCS